MEMPGPVRIFVRKCVEELLRRGEEVEEGEVRRRCAQRWTTMGEREKKWFLILSQEEEANMRKEKDRHAAGKKLKPKSQNEEVVTKDKSVKKVKEKEGLGKENSDKKGGGNYGARKEKKEVPKKSWLDQVGDEKFGKKKKTTKHNEIMECPKCHYETTTMEKLDKHVKKC